MNKIQLIILWCMGIILSVFAIIAALHLSKIYSLNMYSKYMLHYLSTRISGIVIPVLIIGSLLIYTFRSKK